MKFATIVPLIGGVTLGMEAALGKPPEFLLSYKPFSANDQHVHAYYNQTRKLPIPLIHLDEHGNRHPMSVDIVNALCPCAGLSALSPSASPDNKANDWMIETAKYVLGEMKPKVFWGENAPGLAGKVGKPVLAKLDGIAQENGYTTTALMTSSHLHGIGQTRIRSFYFFFKGDEVPLFEKMRKPHYDIDKLLLEVSPDGSEMDRPINPKKPSRDDPFYRFLLEEVEGGITHRQYYDKIDFTAGAMDRIEKAGYTYDKVSVWMRERQMHNIAERCLRIHEKLQAGGNVMRKVTEVPKVRINAFVGHMPGSLTHPHEDRYVTYREALTIMGLPRDFVLQGGRRNANHICQNVPVKTATDVAGQVLKALRGELDTVKQAGSSYGRLVLVQDNRKDSAEPRPAETEAAEMFA